MQLIKALFIGLPGAGKGTQAKLLKERNLYHLSTGDVIREAFAKKDPVISQYEDEIQKRGGYLPDELIFGLIGQYIKNLPEDSKGYVLDGAIRTIPQAEFAVKNNLINIIIDFQLSESEARSRLILRGLKEGRKDDAPEVIEKRFKKYYEETLPASEYLKKNTNFYFSIDASLSVEDVHEEIIHLLT